MKYFLNKCEVFPFLLIIENEWSIYLYQINIIKDPNLSYDSQEELSSFLNTKFLWKMYPFIHHPSIINPSNPSIT